MYVFNHALQAFEEVKEPTRFKRLMKKKIAPVHPAIVVPFAAFVLIIGLAIIWHNFQNEMNLEHQSINQGVSQ